MAAKTTTTRKTDVIFESFLRKQLDAGLALADDSDILTLHPLGEGTFDPARGPEPGRSGRAPRQYLAGFRVRTLARNPDGQTGEVDRFDVCVTFHDEYLRRPNPLRVLTYQGPYRSFHPNVRGRHICLQIRPGMGLADLLTSLYELFTWRLYYTGDNGLNPAASAWARRQDPKRFPTDSRPLKRRQA